MMPDKNLGGLDHFKLIAAFLVVAIHTSPLTSFNMNMDFLLTRILARVAVPFFFMVTGYFVLAPYVLENEKNIKRILEFFKKTGKLYLIAIAIYLPVNFYAGQLVNIDICDLIRMLFFDGTLYHLWYLPASIMGVAIVIILCRVISYKGAFVISVLLYLTGLLGDSYYGLINDGTWLWSVYDVMFEIFSYTRNGIFFAPIFLLMGALLKRKAWCLDFRRTKLLLMITIAVLITEGFALHFMEVQRHDSMYISLIPCMWLLFQFLLSVNSVQKPLLRKAATWIYIMHPWCIVLVRGLAGITGIEKYLVENSLVHFLMVCLLSAAIAVAIVITSVRNQDIQLVESRAWVEVDMDSLHHNVNVLREMLPEGCELMPVVKANAYGHGAVRIAQELSDLQVKAFCAASVSEAAELRQAGIKGEILVLGYTHPSLFHLLGRYDLTQTVVDKNYAEELCSTRKKYKVHIKIDTGMHRLGERSENINRLCSIWEMKNLKITGIYTHLSCSDSMEPMAKEYTGSQISTFHSVLTELDKRELSYGKVHLLASYGLLNYPEYAADYVRVGIALYGVLSQREDLKECPVPLQPVLALKARVALVKNICAGESVGYGMSYTAASNCKIAVLSIGYADGIPRELSCGQGSVLINGEYTPIVGRVCMDQMIVNVTNIPNVKSGDVATIIGQDGDNEITVYDIAEAGGTISNEILSRLGSRLEYKYL